MSAVKLSDAVPVWRPVLIWLVAWLVCSVLLYGLGPYASLPRPAGGALLEELPLWTAADAQRQFQIWSDQAFTDYRLFQCLDAVNALLLAGGGLTAWRVLRHRIALPKSLVDAGIAAFVLTLSCEWLESMVLVALAWPGQSALPAGLALAGGWITAAKMAAFVGAWGLLAVGMIMVTMRLRRRENTR